VSVFPDESKPRVVWVGVDDGGQTTALAQDIETWMDELGFAREKRTYHAHLTLGRVKQGGAPFWRGSAEFAADTCFPSEVVLYQSQLQRQGAEYRALERYTLRQPAKSPTTNPSEEIANHGSKPQ
jgi:2'-5' RNA ligase